MKKKPDRIYDPYCYFKLDIGVEDAYLPLNRNYKPIGVGGRDWVDYGAYAKQYNAYVILKPKFIARVFVEQEEDKSHLYTYSDGSYSWKNCSVIRDKVYAEQERIARLTFRMR